jgi:beta-lactam-binding protein with PASTA domain
VSIRRLSLELGTVAYLGIAGDPDVVLTQTPPVNAAGVDGPRVSLLVSDPGSVEPQAYVMPSLMGLSYSAANARAATAGLRLVQDAVAPVSAVPADGAAVLAPQPAPAAGVGVVIAQNPQAGRRVVQGDAVHITLANAGPAPGLAN